MKKILVLFGGLSPEHYVSIVSGLYVANNIDKKKYKVEKAYIDKKGNWYVYKGNNTSELEKDLTDLVPINNIFNYLKKFDKVFPVLHGQNGEDGRIQGLFELAQVPYVGTKVLGSALGMDKAYAKVIFSKAGIKQAKHLYIKKASNSYVYIDKKFNEQVCNNNKIKDLIKQELGFPIYIKPSNSGSSLGISKVTTEKEITNALNIASKYDDKIVIEEDIKGREFECAVFGNEEVIASKVGEIISANTFYDYDSKYKNQESKTIVNPNLDKKIEMKIQQIAIKAYKAIDGKGLSRVDFFLDEDNNIYLGEINTMPGFTNISMYPKLFEASGIEIKELLTNIIELQ